MEPDDIMVKGKQERRSTLRACSVSEQYRNREYRLPILPDIWKPACRQRAVPCSGGRIARDTNCQLVEADSQIFSCVPFDIC